MAITLKQKIAIKSAYYWLKDRLASLRGGDRPLLPPSSLRPYVGPGDYLQIGIEGRELLKSKALLQPDSRMLDIGCGPGRIALALMDYLDSRGEYHGFDVMTKSLKWAQDNISSRKPNFRFEWIDVYSEFYNPKGSYAARDYTFPCENNSFDVVLCASLFTHMLPKDTERYLTEIGRMLKPGGRAIATFFLLNEEAEKSLASGKATFSADHQCEGARVFSKEMPEYITAQNEQEVRLSLQKAGLECIEVFYGSWSGPEDTLSSQDVMILTKPDNAKEDH